MFYQNHCSRVESGKTYKTGKGQAQERTLERRGEKIRPRTKIPCYKDTHNERVGERERKGVSRSILRMLSLCA